MQLRQVKALVTGGVSGLGLAMTRHIISNGGKAVMLDINDEAGAAAEAELGARYIRTDVTSEGGVEASVSQAAEPTEGLTWPSTAPESSAPGAYWAGRHRWRWISSARPSWSTWSAASM